MEDGSALNSENLTEGMEPDVTFFNEFFDQRAKFGGGGFGIGLASRYHFFSCLSLSSSFGIMGIVGETRYDFSSFNEGGVFLSSTESWWHFLPALDFKIGLNYLFCLSCLNIRATVGYELNYYFHILRYASLNTMPTPDSERIPLLTPQNIGFGGPFVKLAIGF